MMTFKSDGAFTVLRDAGYVSAHSCQILHGDSQMVTHNTHRCVSVPEKCVASAPCVHILFACSGDCGLCLRVCYSGGNK